MLYDLWLNDGISFIQQIRQPSMPTLDRELIASQCMDIHRNPRISKRISIKSMENWRLISIKHGYRFMDIYCLEISIEECPCMDIRAWISMWISTLVWIIEDWHPKIMYIHVDIRGFLEIHAWICYGFSDQGTSCDNSPSLQQTNIRRLFRRYIKEWLSFLAHVFIRLRVNIQHQYSDFLNPVLFINYV